MLYRPRLSSYLFANLIRSIVLSSSTLLIVVSLAVWTSTPPRSSTPAHEIIRLQQLKLIIAFASQFRPQGLTRSFTRTSAKLSALAMKPTSVYRSPYPPLTIVLTALASTSLPLFTKPCIPRLDLWIKFRLDALSLT